MLMVMKSLVIATSGGDAPGMNAAVRAVVKLAASRGIAAHGAVDGFDGLVHGNFRELTRRMGADVVPIGELEGASRLGGSLLGTARSERFATSGGRERAAFHLREHEALVVIGGNGSLTGAHILGQESGVRVIGIPASIDNDVGCTSFCIGVDTALNTIVEACDRIFDTASAHRRAFVVEVMGRECGYLAMASAIAVEADAVLFREQGLSNEDLLASLEQTVIRCFDPARGKKRALIIKAEGVRMSTPDIVDALQARLDDSTHRGASVRATILGHLVRGGNPSYRDRMLAGRFALGAMEALDRGGRDELIAWQPFGGVGEATADPRVRRVPLALALAETARLLDGTSEVTRRRVLMMQRLESVLSL